MLNIRRTGPSMADVIRQLQGVRSSVLPYAAATALTRCAKLGQASVVTEMRTAFDNPVPYTLNATRIEVATVEKLRARIAVKDQRVGGGTRPESFLLPEVQGGARSAKGFENALRHAGVLRAGQFVMPGRAATLDSHGNVRASEVRTVLRALQGVRGGVGAKGQREGRGRKLKNDLFVGKPNGGNRPEGIWRREGRRLRPLFIFTTQAPRYVSRLDFTGTVSKVVEERFRVEFERAATEMQRKFA
jgi:hypothetical protein